jgi:hypothetical protein
VGISSEKDPDWQDLLYFARWVLITHKAHFTTTLVHILETVPYFTRNEISCDLLHNYKYLIQDRNEVLYSSWANLRYIKVYLYFFICFLRARVSFAYVLSAFLASVCATNLANHPIYLLFHAKFHALIIFSTFLFWQ